MTTTAQLIKDSIPEVQFNEWKAGIIAKAKFLLPQIISDLCQWEDRLHRADRITTQLFNELQGVNKDVFNESLDMIRSLIAEYSFQEKDLYLVSQQEFIEKKKDQLHIDYLERSIDLNCDAWTRLLSELHPMMFEFANRAFKANVTQTLITDARFSKCRYQSNQFSFFDSEFNLTEFRDNYDYNKEKRDYIEEEYCLDVMPKLLVASEFSKEKALAFLDTILQWELFDSLQQDLINGLNEKIAQNNAEKVANPIANFNINFLPATQFELGLNGDETRYFLRNLFYLISLTEITPTGEIWDDENTVRHYNDNPSKNILMYNHFNISVSKSKSHYWYSDRKLKVKYVK